MKVLPFHSVVYTPFGPGRIVGHYVESHSLHYVIELYEGFWAPILTSTVGEEENRSYITRFVVNSENVNEHGFVKD